MRYTLTSRRFLPDALRLKLAAAGVVMAVAVVAARADIIARYGGEFMASGGGARALAMGGAYTALPGGAWSLFWNPANLMLVERREAGFMHSERFAGVVDYDAAAVALPQEDGQKLAAGLIRLGVNGVPFTRLEDEGSPLSNRNRVEVSRVVNEGEYALFAARAGQRGIWRWGVAPKLIFKHIGSYRAYGLGADLGLAVQPFRAKPLYAGLAVRDAFGTVLTWERHRTEIIAPAVRAGAGGSLRLPALEATVTAAADLELQSGLLRGEGTEAFHSGLEYLIRETAALRIGSDDGRLTFGGGLQLRPFSLDYAYVGHEKLGDTHRISLTVRWGN